MNDINVILKGANPANPTRSKSWRISLPDDVIVRDLVNELVQKLGYPLTPKNRHHIVYRLYHEQSNRFLPGGETLQDAGVDNNDILILEIKDLAGVTKPSSEKSVKVPCRHCGRMILQSTYQNNDGYCRNQLCVIDRISAKK